MSSVREEKLSFWANNGLNVLFSGTHGVGKTAMVVSTFNKLNYKWRYFSAATMDPWADWIGIPKEKVDPVTHVSYLDLVRPEDFANDTVQALFFDEFNRAPKKVRNAVLELIQFKSINGKKFNNLKLVWAAINPFDEDETYDVDRLDPAQLDRFHVQVDIPYKPDVKYFRDKYGEKGFTAVSWWDQLATKDQKLVSPRRLDYIVDYFNINGDIRDMLPKSISADQLIIQLNSGAFGKRLRELFTKQDKTAAKDELAKENFYNGVIDEIVKKEDYLRFFFDSIPEEKLANLLVSDAKARELLLDNVKKSPVLKTIADNIVQSNGAKKQVIDRLKQWTTKNYASASTTVAAELNKEINSAFVTKAFDNTIKRINLLEEIDTNAHVWANNTDVKENACRFVCETIIRSQESTLKFKKLDARINRIIYNVGRVSFINYFAGKERYLRQKYNNKVDKILKYINDTYNAYEENIPNADKIVLEELAKKADETKQEESNDNETILVDIGAVKSKGRRGRPKKNVVNTPPSIVNIIPPSSMIIDPIDTVFMRPRWTPSKTVRKKFTPTSSEYSPIINLDDLDNDYDSTGTDDAF